jgi:hypothetical protein
MILLCISGCARTAPGGTYDAGYIFPDKRSRVIHDFVVSNTASEPIRILDVQRSCTCTAFKLAKYELAPGEKTTLTMDVEVPRSLQLRFATCTLETDDPRFKKWAFTVRLVSLPFLVADPADLNLGSFTVDGRDLSAVRTATLDFFADSKIELTKESLAVPEDLEISLSPATRVRRLRSNVWNTTYQASVRLSARGRETVLLNSPRPGIVTKTIQINLGESAPRRPQYSVYWQTLEPLEPLEAHPSYVSFGNLLDDAESHCTTVSISSTVAAKFRIVSVENQSQSITIESTVESGGDASRHTLVLKASGPTKAAMSSTGAASRFLSGTIQVRTTEKRRPVVDIPWSAMLDMPATQRTEVGQPKSSAGSGPEDEVSFHPNRRGFP